MKMLQFFCYYTNRRFSITQDKFLALLQPNAYILDFGCGSGRDTKYFMEHGYRVEATDGSEELCKLASTYTGVSVKYMLFQELDEQKNMMAFGHVPLFAFAKG